MFRVLLSTASNWARLYINHFLNHSDIYNAVHQIHLNTSLHPTGILCKRPSLAHSLPWIYTTGQTSTVIVKTLLDTAVTDISKFLSIRHNLPLCDNFSRHIACIDNNRHQALHKIPPFCWQHTLLDRGRAVCMTENEQCFGAAVLLQKHKFIIHSLFSCTICGLGL